jgi:starvation-inducible DNA-binding protein
MTLEEQLKIALASLFGLHMNLYFYHLNVEGPDFSQNHKFFNKFYEYVAESFDKLAEEIRALDIYCPVNFKTYAKLSVVSETNHVHPAHQMFKDLLLDTDKVIEVLLQINQNSAHHPGLQNFIQELIDKLNWFNWQVRATCKHS